jgi:hypothetical protein
VLQIPTTERSFPRLRSLLGARRLLPPSAQNDSHRPPSVREQAPARRWSSSDAGGTTHKPWQRHVTSGDCLRGLRVAAHAALGVAIRVDDGGGGGGGARAVVVAVRDGTGRGVCSDRAAAHATEVQPPSQAGCTSHGPAA